jgi:hypothetical protein
MTGYRQDHRTPQISRPCSQFVPSPRNGKPQQPPDQEIEVLAIVRTSEAIQTNPHPAAANGGAYRARQARTFSGRPSTPATGQAGSQALERLPQARPETSRG